MDSNDSFTQRVYHILAAVPQGYVTTYGDIALLAGSPRAARQVGGILKRLPEESRLPWHRVINRQGLLSLSGPNFVLQRDILIAEGIPVSTEGQIDLIRYRWYF